MFFREPCLLEDVSSRVFFSRFYPWGLLFNVIDTMLLLVVVVVVFAPGVVFLSGYCRKLDIGYTLWSTSTNATLMGSLPYESSQSAVLPSFPITHLYQLNVHFLLYSI